LSVTTAQENSILQHSLRSHFFKNRSDVIPARVARRFLSLNFSAYDPHYAADKLLPPSAAINGAQDAGGKPFPATAVDTCFYPNFTRSHADVRTTRLRCQLAIKPHLQIFDDIEDHCC